MQLFTDNKGMAWEIALDYAAMRQIQAQTGHDFTAAMPGPLQVQQFQSPVQLIQSSVLVRLDVLWVLCRERAESKAIPRAQWEQRIEGPPLRDALAGFNRELTDFFRRNECAAEAEFVQEMQAVWTQPRSKPAKTSPESSESTPAGTPSAS